MQADRTRWDRHNMLLRLFRGLKNVMLWLNDSAFPIGWNSRYNRSADQDWVAGQGREGDSFTPTLYT